MLIPAIVLITAALVFYTVGVWSERRRGTLLPRHALLFATGLACDASGTLLMSRIAASGSTVGNPLLNGLMAVTGTLALALMGVHLAWAVAVLVRDRPAERQAFHRFSLIVWAIWLVPYVVGAVSANL